MDCASRPVRASGSRCGRRGGPRPPVRRPTPAPRVEIDASGVARLREGTSADPGTAAATLATELGELLGRPVDVLSVRANPVGAKHVVSVATREVGAGGPELRSGTASDHDRDRAVDQALLAAHLAHDDLLTAALRRLTADGIARGAVVVRSGTARAHGAAALAPDLEALARHMVTSGVVGCSAEAGDVRVVGLGTAAVAIAPRDGASAVLLDFWARAVLARTVAPAHRDEDAA